MTAVLGLVLLGASPRPINYWVVDGQTLVVQAVGGPKSECALAAVKETATEVRIRIECRDPLLSAGSNGAGYPYTFIAHLAEPLADRRVVDDQGNPAGRCALERCGMAG